MKGIHKSTSIYRIEYELQQLNSKIATSYEQIELSINLQLRAKKSIQTAMEHKKELRSILNHKKTTTKNITKRKLIDSFLKI